MKRFKLSRKEKLLFATPLLLPLLVWAWSLASADGMDRRLRELAGPQAVDCGTTTSGSPGHDPCAIAAFKAGQPFMVRQDKNWPHSKFQVLVEGMARTPQGQIYWIVYSRPRSRLRWGTKASIKQMQAAKMKIATSRTGQHFLMSVVLTETSKENHVWW